MVSLKCTHVGNDTEMDLKDLIFDRHFEILLGVFEYGRKISCKIYMEGIVT